MARLDKRTTNDLVKLLIFIVVTTLATSVLVATIGNLSFTGKKEYQAEFVDATGVVKGDDVRIAGVKVGTRRGDRGRRPRPAPWSRSRSRRAPSSTSPPTPRSATATWSASATSR